MSRKQYDITVNTGGEMGQILDHLLCASDPRIRRQDAKDALRLHAALRAAAREALTVLTRLADSAAYWSDYDVPVGLVAEIDSAKARLAGVLNE